MIDRVIKNSRTTARPRGLASSNIIRQLSQITQNTDKRGSPALAVGVDVGGVTRLPPLPAMPAGKRRKGRGKGGVTAPLPPPSQFCCCSLSRNMTTYGRPATCSSSFSAL